MDGLIPDANDYTHVHMDNATLTAQEGEEEEEGYSKSQPVDGSSFGALTGILFKEEGEEQDRKKDYNPNAIPYNAGHDVAAVA
eukprot:4276669-Ditylum_brightwellii.AAC.1